MKIVTAKQIKDISYNNGISLHEAKAVAEFHNLTMAIKELKADQDLKNILLELVKKINK